MKLSDITNGTVNRPPRIILCGVEKIGKSTFAANSESAIVIPIKGEEGVDALDVAKTPTCSSFADVMAAIQMLYEEKHDFKTVVLDSVSTLEPLIWDAVCAEGEKKAIEDFGFGKGYVQALSKWRELMTGLDALRDEGIGCILIGHVSVKTFSDPLMDSYDQYVLDIHKQAANALTRWSDCILFANSKVLTRKDKSANPGKDKEIKKAVLADERILFTQKRPTHPGGGRGAYGQLPYEMPLSWDAFNNAVKQAKGE